VFFNKERVDMLSSFNKSIATKKQDPKKRELKKGFTGSKFFTPPKKNLNLPTVKIYYLTPPPFFLLLQERVF